MAAFEVCTSFPLFRLRISCVGVHETGETLFEIYGLWVDFGLFDTKESVSICIAFFLENNKKQCYILNAIKFPEVFIACKLHYTLYIVITKNNFQVLNVCSFRRSYNVTKLN
jgi:hypothetical protein